MTFIDKQRKPMLLRKGKTKRLVFFFSFGRVASIYMFGKVNDSNEYVILSQRVING